MDRYKGRAGCKEGEAWCDVCERSGADIEADTEAVEGEAADREIQAFLQVRSRAVYNAKQVLTRLRYEGEELAKFIRQLESWAGYCAVCRSSREVQGHEISECLKRGTVEWIIVDKGIQVVTRELFRKRQIEKFLGCFYCRLLQVLCEQ